MTGSVIAGGSAEQGRPLPWIEVPGFTPPQVHAAAAETAAAHGIMISLPAPDAAPAASATTDSTAAKPDSAVASMLPPEPAVQPKAAAMPKDDDWDLPEGFDSKNAFVPIEAE